MEAIFSVASEKLRTMLTMLGTILGVGLFVAIMGLGSTANGQIARGFDELQATHITVTDIATKNGQKPGYNFSDDAQSRIEKLNGVRAAGVFYNVNLNTDLAGAKKQRSVSVQQLIIQRMPRLH